MTSARIALVLGAALAASGALGCEDYGAGVVACERPETPEPQLYTGGIEPNDCIYLSWNVEITPEDGERRELLYFPGGAWYEIEHQLDDVPDWFMFYLSFERHLSLGPDDHFDGSIALAAGNQAEIKAVSDRSITVLNGTCSDAWLLAIVGKSPCEPGDL